MAAIRSILIWLAMGTLILAWVPLQAVVWLFDRDPVRYTTGRMFRHLGALLTRVNPAWRIEVFGPVPANPRLPYVVVSNHQSNADPPVVSRLPWEMKWVAKKALFDTPVVGWLMKMAGDIQVDRGDSRSRAQVLIRAKEILEQKCSVMFFPEGTRSRDGRVHLFQDGAFRLAVKAQVPILPVALDGTSDALPKHGWKFGPTQYVRLQILDPIPTTGLTNADVPALRDRARAAIVAQIAAWRGVTPDEVAAATSASEPTNAPEQGTASASGTTSPSGA